MNPKALIDQLAGGRVAVIGDVILDHYVHGVVERISPEAPVPVLHARGERHVLGGAANVANNIAALGGQVRLIGVVGSDYLGLKLAEMLTAIPGVEPVLQVAPSHPTIQKTRYVVGQQQIVRVDREMAAPYPAEAMAGLLGAIEEAVHATDCVILSDYGKGVLSDAVIAKTIAIARAAGKRVVVDPKRLTFEAYRGADFITPNRKELSNATGLPTTEDDEAAAAAAEAMRQSGAAILLTRSERGMSLFRADAPPVHLPVEAKEVFDVSGAGDTVVASLALGLATRMPVDMAMRLANAAAGVVVGKLGTATCSPGELLAAMTRGAKRTRADRIEESDTHPGLTTRDGAVALREQWRKAGLSVGFTNGCFDLIHPGHVTLLQRAAEACDRLIVAINTDASVRMLKGPTRPVQDENSRAIVLSRIKGVDLVVAFGEETPLDLIQTLLPDIIVKGADYREHQVVGADVVKAHGGRVMLVDLVAGQSTSNLVRKSAGKT